MATKTKKATEAKKAIKTKKPAAAKAAAGTTASKTKVAKPARSRGRSKSPARPAVVTEPALPVFPAPIFLLAPPRSFTSVMCGMIGQHPELLGSPELNLFLVQTMGRFLRLSRMHTGVKRLIAQLYAGEQTIESIVMARNFLFARRDLTTADVHRELCAKIAPRALVQKSPRYHRRVRMMEAILEAFPDARFIHVLRHPRGMCQSYLDLYDPSGPLLATAVGAIDRSGPEPVADPQILWHDYNLRILHFQKQVHPSRWLRVTGEDFLADMDAQLTSLCGWLGVSDSPEAIAAMKRPEDSPFASFGPINAMFGNDPKFMQDPILRPYTRRAQSLTDPLPWRPDGAAFHPRVVEMANGFGYM